MSAEQTREAFELYMFRQNICTRLKRSGIDGHYLTISVQRAWELWQAALSTQPQAPQGAVTGWQPIETAPEGKVGYSWMLLAWGPEEDQSVSHGMRWGDRFFATGTFHCLGKDKRFEFREIEIKPTHWMPLPAAPETPEGKK